MEWGHPPQKGKEIMLGIVRGREARGRKKSGASVKIHSLFLQ
jgi:hypothetical protein